MPISGGSTTTFLPHLKFQQKMAYSWENDKRTPRRTPFEWTLKGYIRNDNAVGAHRISHFCG
jgi:hypothetical protein